MKALLSLFKKIVTHDQYLSYKYKFLNTVSRRLSIQNPSYSQCGEDMVIKHLVDNKENGFFIDVGSFHPINLSNTYHFYNQGWRGINIDATPGSMKLFNLLRQNDINLEYGIGDKDSLMDYYIFDKGELNSFNKENAKHMEDAGAKLLSVVPVRTTTLAAILDQHMPVNINKIDLLTVDVEGLDELVLRSNNWVKYKPKVIAIERHISFPQILSDTIYTYLLECGYSLVAKAGPTYIFKDLKAD